MHVQHMTNKRCLVLVFVILTLTFLQVIVNMTSKTLDSEEQALQVWWHEQLSRRRRVVETCATLGVTTMAHRTSFLYDPRHRLLFCRNAKVGVWYKPASKARVGQ